MSRPDVRHMLAIFFVCLCVAFNSFAAPAGEEFSPGVFYMPKTIIMAHQWEQESAYNEFVGKVHVKPTLGFYDASAIETMEWQIDVAQKAGIQWFVFDVFLSRDSGEIYFNESLNAFLKSKNKGLLKFAAMYSNPKGRIPSNPKNVLRHFEKYAEWNKGVIDSNSNYMNIDGRPIFMMLRPETLYEAFVTIAEAKGVMNKRVIASELRSYMNGVFRKLFGNDRSKWPIIVSARMPYRKGGANLFKLMGVEFIMPYSTFIEIGKGGRANAKGERFNYDNFASIVKKNNRMNFEFASQAGLKAVASVPSGYSKVVIYEKGGEIVNATGEKYETLLVSELELAKKDTSMEMEGKKLIALGAWNEWSDGHSVAPGRLGGFEDDDFGRVNAVSRVFLGKDFDRKAVQPPPLKPVPAVKKLDVLDFKNSDVPYVGWLQKGSRVNEGLKVSFDERAPIEFPVEHDLTDKGVQVTIKGLIEEVATGVGKFRIGIRCRVHGYPVWENLYGYALLQAKKGPFEIKVPVVKRTGGLKDVSRGMRSMQLTADLRTQGNHVTESSGDSTIVFSSISFLPDDPVLTHK